MSRYGRWKRWRSAPVYRLLSVAEVLLGIVFANAVMTAIYLAAYVAHIFLSNLTGT